MFGGWAWWLGSFALLPFRSLEHSLFVPLATSHTMRLLVDNTAGNRVANAGIQRHGRQQWHSMTSN